jgi:hypothetical protein
MVKLGAVYFVYLGFNWFVLNVLNKNVSDETLMSLLLLPALYILKDLDVVIDPLTIKIERHRDRISVVRGLTPRVRDTLEFKSVENIEVITTVLGSIFDFSTVILYSPGGNVVIPYVYKAHKVVRIVHKAKGT